MHENQPYPPPLSEFGKLRFGKKSDLLTCVKPANTEQPNPPPIFDCKILDGAAVVHALPSTTVSTFDSYAEKFLDSVHSESPIEQMSGHCLGYAQSRIANFQFLEYKEVNVTSDEFVVTSRGSSDHAKM